MTCRGRTSEEHPSGHLLFFTGVCLFGGVFVVCFVLAAQHSFAIFEVGLIFGDCTFPFISLLLSQSVHVVLIEATPP